MWYSYSTFDNLPTNIRVPNRPKSMNVKVFNVITGIYEAEIKIKHISCDCRGKSNSTTCHSNKKIME